MIQYNKFIVGAAGNGNVIIRNPQPVLTREDAINLITWLKIVATVSDAELNECEEAITSKELVVQPTTGQQQHFIGEPSQQMPSPTLNPPSPTKVPEQRIVTGKHSAPVAPTSPTLQPRNPQGANPGIAKCKNGHVHNVTWTVSNRIRNATPHLCPECAQIWTEIGPVPKQQSMEE